MHPSSPIIVSITVLFLAGITRHSRLISSPYLPQALLTPLFPSNYLAWVRELTGANAGSPQDRDHARSPPPAPVPDCGHHRPPVATGHATSRGPTDGETRRGGTKGPGPAPPPSPPLPPPAPSRRKGPPRPRTMPRRVGNSPQGPQLREKPGIKPLKGWLTNKSKDISKGFTNISQDDKGNLIRVPLHKQVQLVSSNRGTVT